MHSYLSISTVVYTINNMALMHAPTVHHFSGKQHIKPQIWCWLDCKSCDI